MNQLQKCADTIDMHVDMRHRAEKEVEVMRVECDRRVGEMKEQIASLKKENIRMRKENDMMKRDSNLMVKSTNDDEEKIQMIREMERSMK